MCICCQVDDLAIGCANAEAIRDHITVICKDDGIDLRNEGILASFNGVDVAQTDRYIKVSCESYIDKLLVHYGWSSSGSRDTDEKPIEALAASTTQQMFDNYATATTAPRDGTAPYRDLETAAGFSYRSVLGALIYAYAVARPDIGYAVTTLARFSDHPAQIHYDALRRVARYLRMTKTWGLFYWRRTLIPSLLPGTFQPLVPYLTLLISRNLSPRPNLPGMWTLHMPLTLSHAVPLPASFSCSVVVLWLTSPKSIQQSRRAPPKPNSLLPSMPPKLPSTCA